MRGTRRTDSGWYRRQKYGSSPRVRGTRQTECLAGSRNRFIPACAGNADRHWQAVGPSPVHPRVCGERHSMTGLGRAAFGSSPRVRGTPGAYRPCTADRRFIPACAGNAGRRRFRYSPASVHPRVCGERPAALPAETEDAGSSPRVRGTRDGNGGRPSAKRFIPACAGNASSSSPIATRLPVHPRVCGERKPCPMRVLAHTGSSPRVRGTPCDSAIAMF